MEAALEEHSLTGLYGCRPAREMDGLDPLGFHVLYPLIIYAEVMSDLMDYRVPDLLDYLIISGTDLLNRFLEQRYLIW